MDPILVSLGSTAGELDPVSNPTETVTTTTTTTSPQPQTATDISFNSLTTDTESLGAAATEVDDDADSGAPGSPSPPRPPPSINSRRCPIKAGCFRRLRAYAKLREAEAALLRASKPPAAKVEDPDMPNFAERVRYWKQKLTGKKSSPANPVLNPDENSLSQPPSNKSQETLPDKVVDQLDDTENSSGSESYQLVRYDKAQGENTLSVPSKKGKFTIDTYAVQCSDCQKWRVIPSKLRYEQIRENIIQVPFSCKYVLGWNPEVTCQYPTDISADDGKVWAIDIPCIPQTPLGWERKIIIRSDQGTRFADVYYISPAGRKIRSRKEVEKYLGDNPDNSAGLQLSQFVFKVPKPAESSGQSKPIEPTEALSPVHEDSVHNFMLVPHREANPISHIPVTLALEVPVMLPQKRKAKQMMISTRKKALPVMFKRQT